MDHSESESDMDGIDKKFYKDNSKLNWFLSCVSIIEICNFLTTQYLWYVLFYGKSDSHV